jgi:HlyD family secretion protein
MDGTILDVQVTEGQVITSIDSNSGGTTLVNIADLSQKRIRCHVNQVDIAGVREEDLVNFTVTSLPDEIMQGVVTNVAPVATVVDGVKGFQVRVLITRGHPRLRPGMTAEATFEIAEAKDVLSVPISAVFMDGEDRQMVYIRDGSSMEAPWREQFIEVGLSNYDYAEIKSGLKEGQETYLVRPTTWGMNINS